MTDPPRPPDPSVSGESSRGTEPTRQVGVGAVTPSSQPAPSTAAPGSTSADQPSGSSGSATAPSPFGPGLEPPGMGDAFPRSLEQRYRFVRVLGKGGFANVYLAYDSLLDQQVAIKVLKLGLASPADRERFLFEARVSAKLRHPNIATVFDVIQTPDGLQMIMEYYPEGTLADRLKQKGALRPRDAIDVARQVAQALAYAHRREIIHRDVKPANIFFASEGLVKLGDFGIAAHATLHEHTQTGMIIGTPLYMAPEQGVDSRDVDPRTDIYALGLTLYHMLTGQPPRVVDLDAVPEPFRKLLKSATAPQRQDRPVSCEQFIAMLDQIDVRSLAPGPSKASAPSAAPARTGEPIDTATATAAATPARAEEPVATEPVRLVQAPGPTAAHRMPRWYFVFALVTMAVIGAMGAVVWIQRDQLRRQAPSTTPTVTPESGRGGQRLPGMRGPRDGGRNPDERSGVVRGEPTDGGMRRFGPRRGELSPPVDTVRGTTVALGPAPEPPSGSATRPVLPVQPEETTPTGTGEGWRGPLPRRGGSMPFPRPTATPEAVTVEAMIENMPLSERRIIGNVLTLLKSARTLQPPMNLVPLGQAIETLEAYTDRNPYEPLPHLLLGMAYYQMAWSVANAPDRDLLERAGIEMGYAYSQNRVAPQRIMVGDQPLEAFLRSPRGDMIDRFFESIPPPESFTQPPQRGRRGNRRSVQE